MSDYIVFINAILFGTLVSLTIRWAIILYSAHKLKSNQKEPLDRMIEITSEDILNGVIRKRMKQVKMIMDSSKCYDQTMSEMMDNDKKLIEIPKVSPVEISQIYNTFKNNSLSFYLIPNEDVYIAYQKGLLSDSTKCFLNDEIIKRLSDQELKEIKEKEQKQQEKEIEKQRKIKEKRIEDSIKI